MGDKNDNNKTSKKRGASDPICNTKPPKRTRFHSDQSLRATPTTSVARPVLDRFYANVVSLRHYLLQRLPAFSKNRKRKLSKLGRVSEEEEEGDAVIAECLDQTLVGVPDRVQDGEACEDSRKLFLYNFTQELVQATGEVTRGSLEGGELDQTKTVNFILWRLFKKYHRPTHLLCQGFQRAAPVDRNAYQRNGVTGHLVNYYAIPGVEKYCKASTNYDILTNPAWSRLKALLGDSGDRIMQDLLFQCGIFFTSDPARGNYAQISGTPLSELRSTKDVKVENKNEIKKPGAITFVRSRMLYARATMNAKGGVRFGMRHIHVLNRFPDLKDKSQTVHIMKYIFPRQFGLHNVFTSKVDYKESALPVKDYTLREKEISLQDMPNWKKTYIPQRRLRHEAVHLVDKLRKLHSRCSYFELLRHYCPVEALHLSTKADWRKHPRQTHPAPSTTSPKQTRENQSVEQTSFTDLATPQHQVVAFVSAVVANVIPNGSWGNESTKKLVMRGIEKFVWMRKFESFTLHEVTQEMQISDLSWLRLPGQHLASRMDKGEFEKRREIFMEFVYWVFDSFVIPLIRTNFYVTESNVDQNRLFYFRHDVWLMLSEPSLASLKLKLFEEVPTERASKMLTSRALGYSKVRLLPKKTGARMINNLKRRPQFVRNGVTMLGRSINAVLGPVFTVLKYEKSSHPDRLGSSLFSVRDMYPKLVSFKNSLQKRGLQNARLYFAKVDVRSCFDTIPQKLLLTMADRLFSLQEYQIGRHVEMSVMDGVQQLDGAHINPPPTKRYVQHVKAPAPGASFEGLVRDSLSKGKSKTVFVDTTLQRSETRHDLLQLLGEHVEHNLVKFGKKFYRQKTGIPQGSVLSSILCNFFYAELEREELAFALTEDSLLMRLLDDFLLISIDPHVATRFVQVMHRGHPKYGVSVKADKSLANFEVKTEDGARIAQPVSDGRFPYCGVLIDTQTLEVSKNSDRSGRGKVADSLTIDVSKVPGQTFHRKSLNGFKLQLQTMFIDTSLNSVPTVLANLHQAFSNSALRCYEYVRVLSRSRPTHPQLLIKTVERIIGLACAMLQRRPRNKASENGARVRQAVGRRQVQWIACKAFASVFGRRQTQHGALLAWLAGELAAASPRTAAERCLLEDAVVVAGKLGCSV